jgi:hypothetical protein
MMGLVNGQESGAESRLRVHAIARHGAKCGKRSLETMTAEERHERAKTAVAARIKEAAKKKAKA